MTVASTTNKAGPYNGNGVTSNFAVSFKYTAKADVDVIVTSTAGVETTKTLDLHYTLTVPGDTGTVSFITTPTDFRPQTGETVTIVRTMAMIQDMDLTSGGGLSANTVEANADTQLMQIQEIAERVSRAPLLRQTSAAAPITLPQPVADNLIAWNSAGTDLENKVAADLDIGLVSPFILTLLDDLTAAAARTTLDAQQLDADLTAIAALSTVAYGRSLLTLASATALAAEVDSFFLTPAEGDALFLTPAEGNAAYQPLGVGSALAGVFDVTVYGAVGDGTTNDSVDIQAACDACEAAGGGIVWLPPTGAAYVCSNIDVGEGVILMGVGSKNFPGATAPLADWTAAGSWLHSPSTVNPTINLEGHGAGVIGLNFIRTQPTPSGGAYTPTTFPYEIVVTANLFTVKDIMTVATTHDLHIAYTDPSGGGAYSRICNIASGALIRGIKFDCVNDTLYMSNIRIRGLWYASTQSLVDYLLANLVGFDVGTLDNPQINDVEFFHAHTGMLFTDQTVQSNVHSMVGGQCKGVAFNLCRYAMRVVADAVVTGTFTDVSAQGATTEGLSDTLFLLDSDEVNLNFNGLRVAATGGRAMEVGGGAGGTVFIDGLDVESYSDVAASSVATVVNAGATLKVGHPWSIASAFGITPGAVFSGAGEISTGNYSEVFVTDNRLFKADGTTGKLEQTGITVDDSDNVTGMATLTLPNTGLHILDTNATHDLIVAPGSNLTADRTLTLSTGDTNIAIDLTDPGADRLMFWDDSAGTWRDLTLGTNLSITTTTINAAGGITTLASGSFAAANTQTIMTSIPATYSYLVLEITGLSSNTATRKPFIQFSTNNGSSYDTTGTNYRAMALQDGDPGGVTTDPSAFGFAPQVAASAFNGTLNLYGYQGGPHAAYTSVGNDSVETKTIQGIYFGSASAINAIRMIWDQSGNSDAGTYALYGIA